jgi:hypothetical protein
MRHANSYAMDIIREAAKAWDRLINGNADPGSISLLVTPKPLRCK